FEFDKVIFLHIFIFLFKLYFYFFLIFCILFFNSFVMMVSTIYAYNEGLLVFECNYYKRLRANLSKVHPAAGIIVMSDGLPRAEGDHHFIAWSSAPEGRTTLADCYTDANGTSAAGYHSQFDQLRHPHFRMNIVY